MFEKNQRWNRHYGLLSLALLCFCCGCAEKSPYDRIGYSGTVTLDGEPLKVGCLFLEPLENQPVQSFAYIKEGTFTVPPKEGVTEGRYRVVITNEGMLAGDSDESKAADASAGAAPVKAEPKSAPKKQVVPRVYGTGSKLEMVVNKAEKNEFSFELVSTR